MKKDKKILFIVDVRNWAFYNNAKQLSKNLKKMYSCDILVMEDLDYNVIDMFLIAADYDLIHIFWRGFLLDLENSFSKSYIHNLGLSFEYFINNFVLNKKIITGVYDHSLLCAEKINDFSRYVTEYYVCSSKLFNLYKDLNILKKPSGVITDGVDNKLFNVSSCYKAKLEKDSELVIGWAGNSKWGNSDNKGLHSIIKPCISKLIDEGYNISLFLADSNEKKISHDAMPYYYNNIDVYVCASEHEGTPNPVLEAMACGRPVISTNVGIVNEVFGNVQKEFILRERTVECLEGAIKKIYENRDLLDILSRENLDSIKKYDWKNISLTYKEYIKKIID